MSLCRSYVVLMSLIKRIVKSRIKGKRTMCLDKKWIIQKAAVLCAQLISSSVFPEIAPLWRNLRYIRHTLFGTSADFLTLSLKYCKENLLSSIDRNFPGVNKNKTELNSTELCSVLFCQVTSSREESKRNNIWKFRMYLKN